MPVLVIFFTVFCVVKKGSRNILDVSHGNNTCTRYIHFCSGCVWSVQSLCILQHTPALCSGKDKINRNFEMILKSFRQTLN